MRFQEIMIDFYPFQIFPLREMRSLLHLIDRPQFRIEYTTLSVIILIPQSHFSIGTERVGCVLKTCVTWCSVVKGTRSCVPEWESGKWNELSGTIGFPLSFLFWFWDFSGEKRIQCSAHRSRRSFRGILTEYVLT